MIYLGYVWQVVGVGFVLAVLVQVWTDYRTGDVL